MTINKAKCFGKIFAIDLLSRFFGENQVRDY